MTPVEIVLVATGVVAAVGAVVGAVATILDLRATKRSVSLAEEQARTRPALEISFELLDVREVEEVWEQVKYVLVDRHEKAEKEREEERKREKKEREREKKERERREIERKDREEQEARARRIREGNATAFDMALGNTSNMNTGGFGVRSPLFSEDTSKLIGPPIEINYLLPNRYDSEPYDGPLPERVVMVGVGNRGRIAAYDVAGWLYFDADDLEPLKEFSDADVADEPEDGFFKVEVGFVEGDKILPTPNDDREFSIAVAIRTPGITTIRYEFQTPQGDTIEDEQELELIRLPELSGQ